LSERAFSRAYGRLRKKVAAGPHFAELEAIAAPAADASFAYKSAAILPRFFFFRALWIDYLLQNNGTVTVEDMPRVFVESANEPITEQSWKGWLERAPRAVPIGLYVLFRCFFFDDQARLAEAVRACGASESRILRDAAKLVEELENGRKTLGTIRNVKKLKASFLELDIDPNRREQREREREKDGGQRQARSQRLRVAAARAIDAGVALEDLAWEKIDEASAHDEVLRAMRDRPEMQTTLAIVDYVDHDGHAHDNLILENEREEALLALEALGDRAIVPILVGRHRAGTARRSRCSRRSRIPARCRISWRSSTAGPIGTTTSTPRWFTRSAPTAREAPCRSCSPSWREIRSSTGAPASSVGISCRSSFSRSAPSATAAPPRPCSRSCRR
jgi:hypothetical protein